MGPELEALILAYDAAQCARDTGDFVPLLNRYKALLEDACSRRDGVDRAKLEDAVRSVHLKWSRANKRHSSIPPKA